MKREIAAVAILAIMSVISVLNIKNIYSITDNLSSAVEQSYQAVNQEDWENALLLAKEAQKTWDSHGKYANIFLCHTDIDNMSDAFLDYVSALYQQDKNIAKGSYEKLIFRISDIKDAESITLDSIL